jgi:hypothetical protein
MTVLGAVTEVESIPSCAIWTIPKSMTLGPIGDMMIFAGVRSRWTIFAAWKHFNASARVISRLATVAGAQTLDSGVLGPYRDRGRWFDRLESEKCGHASGADAWKGAKHVLEFTGVNGGNVEQDVVRSGNGVGAKHIRQAVQSPCELGVTGFGMFSKGDQDEGFDAQSDFLVINDGSDSLDSAVAAELLDPSQSGGGRKPEAAGELDIGQVAAYL